MTSRTRAELLSLYRDAPNRRAAAAALRDLDALRHGPALARARQTAAQRAGLERRLRAAAGDRA